MKRFFSSLVTVMALSGMAVTSSSVAEECLEIAYPGNLKISVYAVPKIQDAFAAVNTCINISELPTSRYISDFASGALDGYFPIAVNKAPDSYVLDTPVLATDAVVVTLKSSGLAPKTREDLGGLEKVSGVRGNTWHGIVLKSVKDPKFAGSYAAAAKQLTAGRINAFVVDALTLDGFFESGALSEADVEVSPSLLPLKGHLAMVNKHLGLKEALNKSVSGK